MADEGACSTPEETKKFTLFKSGENVFVWDPETVFELRTKYRIVGSLVGSLPRKPRQNIYLSLPLVLSKEETTLLLEKQIAQLVESEKDPPLPTEEEVKRFDSLRKESLMEQVKMFVGERKGKKQELSEVIEAGRKRKREITKSSNSGIKGIGATHGKVIKADDDCAKDISNRNDMIEEDWDKWRETASLHGNAEEGAVKMKSEMILEGTELDYTKRNEETHENQSIIGIDLDIRECPEEVVKEIQTEDGPTKYEPITKENLFNSGNEIQIDDLEGDDRNEDNEIDKRLPGTLIHIPTKASGITTQRYPIAKWAFPNTQAEKLRYRIFQELWEKGLYITPGFKFGGDFLAYPGDPVKFHSYYIVVVVPWESKTGMLDVISMGRLGATVKKTSVFASVDSDGNVVYTSVKWSGIS